jgi:hypothetical protein
MARNFEYLRIAAGTGAQVLGAMNTGSPAIPVMSNGAKPKSIVIITYEGTRTNAVKIETSNNEAPPTLGEGHQMGIFQDASYILFNCTGTHRTKYRESGDNTTNFTVYPLEDF